MRDSSKLLLVGVFAAAFPVMAATGFFGGGSTGGGSWRDDPGFIGPVGPTRYCWENSDGTGDCVVTGGWPGTGGGGLTGGGGGGGNCENPEPGLVSHSCDGVPVSPPTSPPQACKSEAEIRREAEDYLSNNSEMARDLIRTIRNLGTSIRVVDGRTDNRAGSYNKGENVIYWDPFMAGIGTNANGSEYTIAPIMVLAHEIVHASERNNPLGDLEPYAIITSNIIAGQINSKVNNANHNTNRNVHQGRPVYVGSIYSGDISEQNRGQRPDCAR